MILFTACVLAVWRAAVMFTEDEGPFGCFLWLREHIDPYQKSWVGRGLNCAWCVSWWGGLVTALWLWYFGFLPLPLVPVWWFGLSGGSVALSAITTWMAMRRR